jgi:hypothetical protein
MPRQEGEGGFARDLADALARQTLAAREWPEIEWREVNGILENYAWSQVLVPVEQVYLGPTSPIDGRLPESRLDDESSCGAEEITTL